MMYKPFCFGTLVILFVMFFLCPFVKTQAQSVTQEEAIVVANHFAAQRLDNKFIPQSPDLYTGDLNGITTYYVFNFFPQGFVIVSANKNIIPVLAYSADNQCPKDDANPALNALLGHYSKQVYETSELKNYLNPKNQQLWSDYLLGNISSPKGQVEPLLTKRGISQFTTMNFVPPTQMGPIRNV